MVRMDGNVANLDGATDAYATSSEWGVGGWFLLNKKLHYFSSAQSRPEKLPFFSGPRPREDCGIESIEGLGVLFALSSILSELFPSARNLTFKQPHEYIQLGSDNNNFCNCILSWRSKCPRTSKILKEVAWRVLCNFIILKIPFIPGSQNKLAHDLSHGVVDERVVDGLRIDCPKNWDTLWSTQRVHFYNFQKHVFHFLP